MNIDELLAAPPLLHANYYDGTPTSYQIGEEALRFIARHVTSNSRTLETGAGLSTVVFTMAGATHTAITPNKHEARRINEFCEQNGIASDRLAFINERSDQALPGLVADPSLDFVLLDGGHGFPIPFLDWFYASSNLRSGGWLLVDNIELWTGRVLTDFLRREPEWRFNGDLCEGTTAVFQKVESIAPKEWCFQPYVVSRSDLSLIDADGLAELPGVNAVRLVVDPIRRGRYRGIAQHAKRRLRRLRV